ncbi:MAG: DUF6090 family protein [Robiginitalea sp.]
MLIDKNIRKPASPAGRYLLYALGEIMLVVIGILIALQINNWNDSRLQKKEARTLYQNTRQQLLEDRQNIEGQIEYNNKNNEQFHYAIALIADNDRNWKDSLCAITGKLVDYSDFDRQGNIYQTIVNSGDVKLLKNEEIKKRLRGLEETYLYINRMETIHYDAIMQMIPEISRTVNITSKEIIDEDELYHPKFQNQFALSLRVINEKEEVYLSALDEIDALLAMIREELKQY